MVSKSIKACVLGMSLLVSSSIEARIIFISGHTGTDRWAIVEQLAHRMPEAKLHTTNLYAWSKMIDFARGAGLIECDANLEQDGRALCSDEAFLAGREQIKALDLEHEGTINDFCEQLDWQPWFDGIALAARDGDVIVGGVLGGPALSSLFGETLCSTDEFKVLMVQAYTNLDSMKAPLEERNASPHAADHRRMIDVVTGFLGLYSPDGRVPVEGDDSPVAIEEVTPETFENVLEVLANEPDNFLSLPKQGDQVEIRKRLRTWAEKREAVPFYLRRKIDLSFNSAQVTPAQAADEIVSFIDRGDDARAAAFNTMHGLWD